MINLWYEESPNQPVCGPKKVLIGLRESLEKCNVPYAINEDKYAFNHLIQYDPMGHIKHEKLEHSSCLIGPQVWPFDQYGEFLKRCPQYYKKLLMPGMSCYLSFIQQGYLEEKLALWPVGIKDINVERTKDTRFLIYQKERPDSDVNYVISFLEKNGYEYRILRYGSYNPEDYYRCLSECSHAIIVGRPETQGIAYQEMMSSDMPLMIWDNREWYDYGIPVEYQKNPAPTSAHYFSEECGEKFYTEEEFEKTFSKFISTKYSPKEFVRRELSYEVSVKKLLSLFEE